MAETKKSGLKLTPEQVKLLKADFPPEAISSDNSRGFELTSIKAAYVLERLTDIFGIGGWTYTFTPWEVSGAEVLTMVTLTVKDSSGNEVSFSQSGGKRVIKENVNDARKSAVTDGLTKCASILGIGHTVFKGLVDSDPAPCSGPGSATGPGSREANPGGQRHEAC